MFGDFTSGADNEPMGMAAEQCAEDHDIGREAQDAYAVESYQRALAAQEAGVFADEIVPVDVCPVCDGWPNGMEGKIGGCGGGSERASANKGSCYLQ